MAKPPMCFCGTAHWFREPHQFVGAEPAPVDRTHPKLKGTVQRPGAPPAEALVTAHERTIAELRATIAQMELEASAADRRRETNRERMRQKRKGEPQ